MSLSLLNFFLFLVLFYTQAAVVRISNDEPRRDVNGNILRVADGCLSKFGDTYYLYGVHYFCCNITLQGGCYYPCGWFNMTFAVYSSKTLESGSWVLESVNIFPLMTAPGPRNSANISYFESCVLYNPKYEHYVLWMNRPFDKATAVSQSPIGPFELVNWELPSLGGSDIYFWIDPNNPTDAYAKHNLSPPNAIEYHRVTKLSDDWLSLSDEHSNDMYPPFLPIPPEYQGTWPNCTEGGGVFSYNGKWYVMFGACCCFCQAGANGYLFMATNPLGPYSFVKDIISYDFTIAHYATRAQQFSVTPLYTKEGIVPMYIGMRWGSALDGLKCHDFQYWYPLKFDENDIVEDILWLDHFTVDLV